MAESTIQRQYAYNGKNEGNYGSGRQPYSARNNYNQAFGMTQGQGNNNGMAYLAQGLQGMSVHDAGFGAHGRTNNMTTAAAPYGGMNINTGLAASFWAGGNQMMFPGAQSYVANTANQSPSLYTPTAAQYVAHGYNQTHDNSPLSQGWASSQATGDIPTLITPRRDSISSNENDAPGTPSYLGYPNFAHGGVPVMTRSPSGTYTSTPSPLQMMTPYGVGMPKVPDSDSLPPALMALVSKDPAIPPAVPAPSSPLKPLDRALENVRGETNVYIRGLLPETSDDMLKAYGERFGDIRSSKSIIDHGTGLCKGFGFVKYHNYKDAEDCIRGFHYLGYETSFARESFYSKLKAIADDGNTNLYVSNLPKNMNEHELLSVFAPRTVLSARILRLKDGTGRGVGFARFESRDDCEEVIQAFNNKVIEANGEEHTIQIRFADTQEQKHLKQHTAAARQFRSAEYEYATQAHKSGLYAGRMQYPQSNNGQGNDFENYLGTAPGVPIQSQRWVQNAWRKGVQRSPLSTVPYDANIRRNQVSAHATPVAKANVQAPRDGGIHLERENADPTIVHGDKSPTDSATENE